MLRTGLRQGLALDYPADVVDIEDRVQARRCDEIDISGQSASPAAQAFQAAAGEIGLRLFGAVLLASALTSIIGAACTSASFPTAFKHDMTESARNRSTAVFIAVSLVSFLLMTTTPAAMLVSIAASRGLSCRSASASS